MLLVFASFFLRNNIVCVKPASQSPFPPGYDFIIFKGTQPRGIPENCQAAEFRRHGDGAESQLPLSQVFRNKGAPQALFFRSPRVACILHVCAQIAAASPSMGMAREVRHSLPGRAATSLPWCHSPLHVLDLSLA